MNCVKCGNQLTEGKRFCWNCGSRVSRWPVIDRGFQLIYWRLSPRRKFYRGLLFLPFTLVGWLINWYGLPGAFWFSLLLAAALGETIYNYVKWKSEEDQ